MQEITLKDYTSFKVLLIIASLYHILWGAVVVLFPHFFFYMEGIPAPNYMELWQMTGFYSIIFGFGYFMAFFNPIRHWRIVLLGFISKFTILLSFIWSLVNNTSSSILYKMILVNHLIWLFPFGLILYYAYKHKYVLDEELIRFNNASIDELLDMFSTNKGNNIKELSDQQPVMLVFLRHLGCVFCKETLMDFKNQKNEIQQKETKVILVNMADEQSFFKALQKYELQDMEFISDPESMLYKAFKLKRGSLGQLFGLKVFLRAFRFWMKTGEFVTSNNGADVYQMPGIFILYKGAVVKQFVHDSVADAPSFSQLMSSDDEPCFEHRNTPV